MTFRRFAVSLVFVFALFACSDGDAVVALNVTASDDVPVVPRLQVTITQDSRKFVYDFAPPTEPGAGDAGPSIQNSFFERITLPDGFVDEEARVFVEALTEDHKPFVPPLSSETKVRIEEHSAVAAYVTLAIPPAPTQPGPGGEAGAGGAGGDSGGAGASGEGGAGG